MALARRSLVSPAFDRPDDESMVSIQIYLPRTTVLPTFIGGLGYVKYY